MEETSILKPTASVSYSIFSKLKKFIGAYLLAGAVFGNAIRVFIETLNKKGLLGLGDDFSGNDIIWGDSIWLNVLHLIITAFIAGLFGFLFGYLTRKVNLSGKIIFTTLYVFTGFIFIALFSMLFDIFLPDYSSEFNFALSAGFYAITSSAFNLTFVVLNYIIMFASSFYFIKVGQNVINDPYYTDDKTKNGTLLDIKWYHYIWLSIPLGVYSQVILNLIYAVGHTIVTLISNFSWTTIFGGTNEKGDNAIDVAWGKLLFIVIAAVIIFYLLDYLRKILIEETNQHWAVKLLIILGVSIVLPFLILYFTTIAG
jgi:hypothetical protein